MSSVYTGDPTAVSNSLSRTITDVTNVSPPVVTTSVAHLFATGDRVRISGVLGATGANGDFTITVLSSTTFSLDGAAAPGVYTSGGTVVDRALTPQLTIPSDGDNLTAASVNGALEGLADRTQKLVDETNALSDDLATEITNRTNGDATTLASAEAYTDAKFDANGQLLVPSTGAGYPVFTASRTRARALLLHNFLQTEALQTPARTADFLHYYATLAGASPPTVFVDGNLKFLNAPGTTITGGISVLLDPLLIDGATLSTVTLDLQGAAGHAGLPGTQPQMGIFRIPKFGTGTTLSLRSAGDFLADAQGTVGAYEAVHSLVFTPDQYNVIDKQNYSYVLQIWNEMGTNAIANLVVYGGELNMTAIADMRPD